MRCGCVEKEIEYIGNYFTSAFNKSLEFGENKSYTESLEINNNRATCMDSHI